MVFAAGPFAGHREASDHADGDAAVGGERPIRNDVLGDFALQIGGPFLRVAWHADDTRDPPTGDAGDADGDVVGFGIRVAYVVEQRSDGVRPGCELAWKTRSHPVR